MASVVEWSGEAVGHHFSPHLVTSFSFVAAVRVLLRRFPFSIVSLSSQCDRIEVIDTDCEREGGDRIIEMETAPHDEVTGES